MRRYCRIHIDLDRNEAFKGAKEMPALAAVLRSIADKVESGACFIRILDPNGSYCGTYEIVEKPLTTPATGSQPPLPSAA